MLDLQEINLYFGIRYIEMLQPSHPFLIQIYFLNIGKLNNHIQSPQELYILIHDVYWSNKNNLKNDSEVNSDLLFM